MFTLAIVFAIVVVLALIGLATWGIWESPLGFGCLFGGWSLLGTLCEGLVTLIGALLTKD